MAESNGTLLQTHHPNPTLQSVCHVLDPISLVLSLNSNPDQPLPPKLTTEGYIMERGPRYRAYAELRESKLRMKNISLQEPEEPEIKVTPTKKKVKFQSNSFNGRKGSSILTQSVPDFSAALRKENRKPSNSLPSILEMTPPSKSGTKINGVLSSSRGSKSANAGDKRTYGGGVLMARKSYASVDGVVFMARKSYASVGELKGLSLAAGSAINSENRVGRSSKTKGTKILGYRQF